MPIAPLHAIERQIETAEAVKQWKRAFSEGAEDAGSSIYIHRYPPLWGQFARVKRTDGTVRYWNAFGVRRTNGPLDHVVEINPPRSGANRHLQGVIARDGKGRRWVLHRGRMRVPGAVVTEELFNAYTRLVRVPVSVSGKIVECFPVANIDATPRDLQRQLAGYVAECKRIRDIVRLGEAEAVQLSAVDAAEALTAENAEPYNRGAQDEKVIERRHAAVWIALCEELKRRGFKPDNARVGGWGPDLRTIGAPRVLFEIKTTLAAPDLQRALGQLLIYEHLLGAPHRKILVLPAIPAGAVAEALKLYGVQTVTFQDHGRKGVAISHRDLDRVCGA